MFSCLLKRLVASSVGMVLLPALVFADVVTPSADVVSRVIVRASASSQSAQIGSLVPGAQAELIGSVPNWHEVRFANGTLGFVSKRWTRVIPTGILSDQHDAQRGKCNQTLAWTFFCRGNFGLISFSARDPQPHWLCFKRSV